MIGNKFNEFPKREERRENKCGDRTERERGREREGERDRDRETETERHLHGLSGDPPVQLAPQYVLYVYIHATCS